MDLKKILIVSSYSPPAIGGPQIIYNLLHDFPVDRYSILTSYYNIDNLSARKGTWLNGEYRFYDNPGKSKSDRIAAAQTNRNDDSRANAFQKLKLWAKRKAFVRALAGLPAILLQVLMIVREGKRAIKSKNIDIMVGISDYGPAMIGTYLLHKLTRKPYHIFLFDLYRGNFFPFPGGLLANIFEKRIFKNAQKIIVTNDGTKDFYENRYGRSISDKCVIIYNSGFSRNYEDSDGMIGKPNKTKKLLFTGRINWPQIGAIKNLIKAINEMDLNVIFEIYSPMPKEHLANIGIIESEKVKIGFAPPEDMPKVQGGADILFLPLSWHTKSQAIIDTATPGKLTDYLISGKPILVHAPKSSFLVTYARENKFAEIVDEENIELLKNGIKRLLRDGEYVQQLAKNATSLFYKNHNMQKNAEVFKKLLMSSEKN